MTINWFTVAAQVVNFLVLVFLLHRFLYGPIVRAMDERREKIAARLQDAEESRRQAEEEADTYRRKQQELTDEREEMLAEMREEVEERRQARLQEIRDESQAMRRQWQEALARDQEEFTRNLRIELGREFFAVARRALADLADVELESQATRAFLRHVRNLDDDQWRALQASLRADSSSLVVRSAFELSPDLRTRIEEGLQESLATEENGADGEAAPQFDVHFETDPSLLAGIELQAQSRVAAWHLADYLNALQEHAHSELQRKDAGEHGADEEEPDEEQPDQQQSSEQQVDGDPETA